MRSNAPYLASPLMTVYWLSDLYIYIYDFTKITCIKDVKYLLYCSPGTKTPSRGSDLLYRVGFCIYDLNTVDVRSLLNASHARR